MSSTFYAPSEELAAALNITYDLAAWGGNTTLYASYAPFQYAQQQSILSALKAVPGMATPKEAADGNATGVFWFPCTVNPENRTRSYYEPLTTTMSEIARIMTYSLPGG